MMSLELFQTLCFPVMFVAYAFSVATAQDRARRVVEIVALAASAWIGEHTVIEAYLFYFYDDGWWLKLGHVPLLVALIWPMVVLSARDCVTHLFAPASRLKKALMVAGIVIFDASIMEVIAVEAGYWTWFEAGYLHVPLMGIVGWGCFGFIACLWLDALERGDRIAAHGLTPVITVLGTHALLLALWWGALRWVLRGDLGPNALVGFGVIAVLFGIAVWRARKLGLGVLPHTVTAPRVMATSVFVALLMSLPDASSQWVHLGAAAVPYLIALRWSSLRSSGAVSD